MDLATALVATTVAGAAAQEAAVMAWEVTKAAVPWAAAAMAWEATEAAVPWVAAAMAWEATKAAVPRAAPPTRRSSCSHG